MSLMSEFADDFSTGAFDLENGMAYPAVYTPSGGSPIDINALFLAGDDLEDAQWRAALQASATAWVRGSDVSEPANGDTISVDSDTWTVTRRKKMPACWKLDLRRDLRPTFRK